MTIQFENIVTFIAAADTGSFSAAGRKLKKSQAAISLAIQNLEIDLGFSLFNRGGKSPQLTQQGELALRDARLLMSQYSFFIERTKIISNVQQVKLSIGIDPLVCNHEVDQLILDFSIAFPFMQLKIFQQNSDLLAQKLADNTLDFAIGLFSRDVNKYEHVPVFKLKGSWVVSPFYMQAHNLQPLSEMTGHVQIDKSTFYHSRFLLPTEALLADIDEFSLTQQIWYVEDLHTLLSFCRNGLGIAFLPNFVIGDDLNKGNLLKLDFDFEQRSTSYCTASLIFAIGYQQSPAVEWLTQHFITMCQPDLINKFESNQSTANKI